MILLLFDLLLPSRLSSRIQNLPSLSSLTDSNWQQSIILLFVKKAFWCKQRPVTPALGTTILSDGSSVCSSTASELNWVNHDHGLMSKACLNLKFISSAVYLLGFSCKSEQIVKVKFNEKFYKFFHCELYGCPAFSTKKRSRQPQT